MSKTIAREECQNHIGFIAAIFRQRINEAEAFLNSPAYLGWFTIEERKQFHLKKFMEAAEWARKMFSYAELIEDV